MRARVRQMVSKLGGYVESAGWRVKFLGQRLQGEQPNSGLDDAFQGGYRAGFHDGGQASVIRTVRDRSA